MDSIMEEEVEKNSPKEEIKEDEKKTKRRRRKLPDIPKNKKRKMHFMAIKFI